VAFAQKVGTRVSAYRPSPVPFDLRNVRLRACCQRCGLAFSGETILKWATNAIPILEAVDTIRQDALLDDGERNGLTWTSSSATRRFATSDARRTRRCHAESYVPLFRPRARTSDFCLLLEAAFERIAEGKAKRGLYLGPTGIRGGGAAGAGEHQRDMVFHGVGGRA